MLLSATATPVKFPIDILFEFTKYLYFVLSVIVIIVGISIIWYSTYLNIHLLYFTLKYCGQFFVNEYRRTRKVDCAQ